MNIHYLNLENITNELTMNVDAVIHMMTYCIQETDEIDPDNITNDDSWKLESIVKNNIINQMIIVDYLNNIKTKNIPGLRLILEGMEIDEEARKEVFRDQIREEFIKNHPYFGRLDERIGKLSGIIKALREIEDVPPELVNSLCFLEWDLLDCNSAIKKNEDLPEYESEEDVSDPKENEDEEE